MAKRATDLLLASVLIIVTLPVLLVSAIVSAVALRAWPFFVQQRVGIDGTPFRFVKIRTLPTSTPAYLLKNDLHLDETPRACRALRRLHVDELPQLFLVLTGRMSLVGPRPEMVEFHDVLDPVFAAERTSIRPGCTGLWQIGAECERLIGEAPEYDRFYLEHRTGPLDLWILARTARMMLGLCELIELRHVPIPADAKPFRSRLRIPRPSGIDFAEID